MKVRQGFKFQDQSGETHIAILISIIMSLLFVSTLIFGIWAFAGKQDYKNNTDKKISTAVAVAVKQAETTKDNVFAEALKSPVKHYTGPSTYGSVGFDFSNTYSAYVDDSETGAQVLNGYFHPNVVPSLSSDVSTALRVEILSSSYESNVKLFDNKVKAGTAKVSAFRAAKVPSVLGIRVDGLVVQGKQGSMVILPLRDKTIEIWTEALEFIPDFTTYVLPSITFAP